MFFTKNDFEKIAEYLKENGMKDTDFSQKESVSAHSDILAIVSEGVNYKIYISDLLKSGIPQVTIDSLKAEVEELRTFKLGVERVEKENMIASFYMLSDEDKAGVIARIDELSVSDIEKELSVICVRNKVSFNLEEDNNPAPTTYNLNNLDDDDASVPAWIKAVRSVAKEMN